MDNSLFRELFEFIISIRRTLVRVRMRECPLREGKGRGREERTLRTQSRAGIWSGSLRSRACFFVLVGDRYASSHARFTIVFSSFVREWRINGSGSFPVQSSLFRLHALSRCSRYVCM